MNMERMQRLYDGAVEHERKQTANKEVTMFKRFFRWILGLFGLSWLIRAPSKVVSERPKPRYEHLQEFSETTTSPDHTILGLQRTLEALEQYHFFGHEDKKDPVTRLTIEDKDDASGESSFTFPGAIPESMFPQILRQTVKISIKYSAFYDPAVGCGLGCEWRCTSDHVLEVLTGELAGQKFEGRRYWLDEYPAVVMRAEKKAKEESAAEATSVA